MCRAKEVHPDRFAGSPAQLQARARTHSSLLNEAHHVLRDPLRRATYLAKLGGFDLERAGQEGGAPAPSQAFLLEMMERRDAAESLASDDDREALLDEVLKERDAVFQRAVRALDDAEAAKAAEALVVVRYLDRFVEGIEASLEEGG